MTTTGLSVSSIFTDAEEMYAAALERLAAGDIRDAADKAWCAALQATNALILARTGELPPKSPNTTRGLRRLAATDPNLRTLEDRYASSVTFCTATASIAVTANPSRTRSG